MDVLKRDATRLMAFVAETQPRDDWHEPDEQGISAHVVGNRLDNACGESISADACIRGYQELVVVLNDNKGEAHAFNLANLLALASRGAYRMVNS